jgi:ankyrin repeat protein
MLRHGAKINAKDKDKQTPLYWATSLDYQQTVSVLLAHGADVNAISKGGWTPLMVACLNAAPDITRLLLDHRADVNAHDDNGNTVLFMVVDQAIRHHNGPHDLIITDIIPQLLARKADPNLPNEYSITDLQVAQQNDRPEIVTLLRQAGAKK